MTLRSAKQRLYRFLFGYGAFLGGAGFLVGHGFHGPGHILCIWGGALCAVGGMFYLRLTGRHKEN